LPLYLLERRSANDPQGALCLCRWEILRSRKYDSQAEIGGSKVAVRVNRREQTPYCIVWYHLKEYSWRGAQNGHELFNHRHSSLRNVIERTFGVLKKRFPIIARETEPHYFVDTMTDIVLTCCILITFFTKWVMMTLCCKKLIVTWCKVIKKCHTRKLVRMTTGSGQKLGIL